MRKRTSSIGRRQFSVENAYTVIHAQADVERALDGVEQRLLPRRVAVGALEPPPLRPAPVAVHHDRDVAGNPPRIELGVDGHGPQAT